MALAVQQAVQAASRALDEAAIIHALEERSLGLLDAALEPLSTRMLESLQRSFEPVVLDTLLASGEAAARSAAKLGFSLRGLSGAELRSLLPRQRLQGMPPAGTSAYAREYYRRRRAGLLGRPATPAPAPPTPAPAPGGSAGEDFSGSIRRADEEDPEELERQDAEARRRQLEEDMPPPSPPPMVPSGPLERVNLASDSVRKIVNGRQTGAMGDVDAAVTAALGPNGMRITQDAANIARDVLPGSKLTIGVSGNRMSVEAESFSGPLSGSRIARVYTKHPNGVIEVHHDFFGIPRSEQGKGHATRMMTNSLEAYQRNGVSLITTYANLNVGGYAWAKQGFRAANPTSFADSVERKLLGGRTGRGRHYSGLMDDNPREAKQLMEGVRRAGMNAPGWLAAQPHGKRILLGMSWDAVIDLRTPWGQAAASQIVSKKKKG